MSFRRNRQSLEPSASMTPCLPQPLGDSTSSHINCNQVTSLGNSNSNNAKNEREQDRRMRVEEWRRTSAKTRLDSIHCGDENHAEKSETVTSGDFNKENECTSALKRLRMLRRLQQQLPPNDSNELTVMTLGIPVASSSSTFQDEDSTGYSSAANNSCISTPKNRPKLRRSLSCGGAQRKVRRKTSLTPEQHLQTMSYISHSQESSDLQRKAKTLLPPSYHTPSFNERMEQEDQQQTKSSSLEVSKEHTTAGNPDSIDSFVLRSKIQDMQKQIDTLVLEKMDLNLSKAPLEARMRQKEDSWVKERERLLSEIESQQTASRVADERYRELEMEKEALTEIVSKLRLEAREATSAAAASGGNNSEKDSWGERVKTCKEIANLQRDIKDKNDQIKTLRIEKVSLETEVFGCKREIEALGRDYHELEKDFMELEASKSQNNEAEIQLEVLTTEHTAMIAQLHATNTDLFETKTRAKADIISKEEFWKAREHELLFEISVLKSRVGKDTQDTSMNATGDEEDAAILKARIEAKDRRIAELEEQLLNGEKVRRELHNRIQELRGNIRVYVRTRPFLPNDGVPTISNGVQSSIHILPDGESLKILGRRGDDTHLFKFDKVFAPSMGQEIIFDEVSEFVQSALDGYHVCLFSYGQTGSGKTHTMQGSGKGAMRGIIPRAVEQILSQAAKMQSQRWTFTMTASFLEIYNEDLRDLLIMMNSDGSTKSREFNSTNKLSIRRNAAGKSYVDGINSINIDIEDKLKGLEQLEAVMAAAARSRSVAATKMNAQSSRSHSVFMLKLCGTNEESGTIVEGTLNLCDLAGSERLDRSGASSDVRRLKETQSINKSLSCLGDVFTALANGSKHIPFRNSKLTYLLQDCLSGDGKALMFVNLSPTLESSSESLCSLRFAQRVNQVELGKATKHVEYIQRSGNSG